MSDLFGVNQIVLFGRGGSFLLLVVMQQGSEYAFGW
jgi:hypothetical protein